MVDVLLECLGLGRPHHALDGAHRERRIGRDLAGQFRHAVVQLVWLDDMVDQPEFETFGRRQRSTGEADLGGLGVSDDARQQPGATALGEDSALGETGVQLRGRRGDSNVATKGQVESVAGRTAVQRADRRGVEVVENHRRGGPEVELAAHVSSAVEDSEGLLLAHLSRQVEASTEGFTGAGQHDAAHVAVAISLQEGFRQVVQHPPGNGVQPLGSIEGDGRNVVIDLVKDFAHEPTVTPTTEVIFFGAGVACALPKPMGHPPLISIGGEPNMQKTRARRVGALILGLALVGAACGGDDESADTTAAPATEAPATEAPATEAPAAGGELEGMKGTTPKGAEVSEEWLQKVSDFWVSIGNAPLEDFNYAGEAYDAAIVIALAVEKAGTDGAKHADEIVGITKDGEKCTTFADCVAIIKAGGDPDYDGISGPHEFNGNGEPLQGSYAMLEFGADNRITEESNNNLIQAEAPESAIVALGTTTATREGDGQLKIGSLLPETGNLAFLGAPEYAGLEYAISEINAAGGVLGKEVLYSQGDSGDTTTDIASQTADRLISENVDAIVGAASSGVTLTVIDKITAAGITMFSPANTSPKLSDYPDDNLYFRNAPADGLQGAVVANQIVEDGNASAYILNLDDAYGNGIAAVVKNVLEAAGVEVKGVKAYDPAAASFDAEVADVVAADPDAVVLISFDEGSRILRVAVESGIGPKVKNWYGTDGNMGNALGENFDAGK